MKKLLLVLFLSIPLLLNAQLNPVNFTSDFAGILTQEEEDILNKKLSDYQKSTKIEIAIVTVESLNGNSIESYANDLFSQWGIGLKGGDNGLLCLIVPNEREWRIEVGYGLEPFITDYASYDIGSNNFPENFRSNNYFIGLNGFVDDAIKELGKITWEERVALQKRNEEIKNTKITEILDTLFSIVIGLLILSLIICLIIILDKKNKKRKILQKYKLDYIKKYEDEIYEINAKLKKCHVDEVVINHTIINNINKSKNEGVVNYFYLTGLNELTPYNGLIDVIERIKEKNEELYNCYNSLNRLEKDLNINEIEKEVFTIDGLNNIESTNRLLSLESKLDNLCSVHKERIKKLEKCKNLINFIPSDCIFTKFDGFYDNKYYKPDSNKIEEFKIKLKTVIDKYNNIPKAYNSFGELEKSYIEYISIINEINSYLCGIDNNNSKYESMVSTIKRSKDVFYGYVNTLYNYNSHSYISSSTRDQINNFNKLVEDFKITDNVFETYDEYLKICKIYKKAEDLCISDKKKKEREEEEIRRKKYEEEERVRNLYRSSSNDSYNGSSSSYSSSDFGGFGGGSSGGGGASGGW